MWRQVAGGPRHEDGSQQSDACSGRRLPGAQLQGGTVGVHRLVRTACRRATLRKGSYHALEVIGAAARTRRCQRCRGKGDILVFGSEGPEAHVMSAGILYEGLGEPQPVFTPSLALAGRDACEGLPVAPIAGRSAAADSSAVPLIREVQRAFRPYQNELTLRIASRATPDARALRQPRLSGRASSSNAAVSTR
jgi:hypothetical protein